VTVGKSAVVLDDELKGTGSIDSPRCCSKVAVDSLVVVSSLLIDSTRTRVSEVGLEELKVEEEEETEEDSVGGGTCREGERRDRGWWEGYLESHIEEEERGKQEGCQYKEEKIEREKERKRERNCFALFPLLSDVFSRVLSLSLSRVITKMTYRGEEGVCKKKNDT
jgi:hypothetical protein